MLCNTVKSLFEKGKLSTEYVDMTFDWEKAARLIREKKPHIAYAMLEGSRDRSKHKIYQDGFPVYEDDTVHSARLRPMIVIDGHLPVPCFKMEYETNGMDVWPRKALDILEGKA